jgi:hypothetical protein
MLKQSKQAVNNRCARAVFVRNNHITLYYSNVFVVVALKTPYKYFNHDPPSK